MRWQTASGIDHLKLVTRLSQRIRSEHPTAGVWEAADFQWWWRVERESDAHDQQFLTDADGDPIGAAVLTRWPRTWGYDILALPSRAEELTPALITESVDRIEGLSSEGVEAAIRHDDPTLRRHLTQAGFEETEAQGAATWLNLEERPRPTAAPDGYHLRDRTDRENRSHHFIPRSTENVEQRLRQTSLYDPRLDLFIESADGAVVAYALFWFDAATGTGLIEPLRTEEGHERRGLATHLITAGLDRLAQFGAHRAKVNYEVGNEASEHLYLGMGFEVESTSTLYVHR